MLGQSKLLLALVLAAALVSASQPSDATIQEESCLEPDIEYPVPCDDDGD
jgi:hypothetical protein